MNRIEVNLQTGETVLIPLTQEEIDALPAPELIIPKSITRRQCARRMMVMGLVTPEEALAMTKSGEPPALVASAFSLMSPEDAILAAIDFAADTYMRSNPLLISLMQATGATEDDIDLFFIEAAKL